MITNSLRGDGLIARAMRSSAWTLGGYGVAQAIRLASNLILTRLLFPETFGMMALVTIAMVGLQQFSDLGIGPSINQNRRGDDPGFLDTAWTIQVVRGFLLWAATCALAWPVSQFYGEPQLLQLLPVTGLTLVISGFNPTRIETANRHLMIGRVTLLDLASQIVGLAATIGSAIAIHSVWALVIGGIAAAIAKLVFCKLFLPGPSNRFRWEPAAAHDLIHFGKWIFVSTICGFMIAQGDRVILGKYLSLEMLGIYNIGYFLASFPLLLGGAVVGRVMIPLYRECPPAASAANYRKLHLMRMPLTALLLALLMLLAFLGVEVVGILYDSRYHLAGPIVVLIASLQLPQLIGLTYDHAALAAGDSRRFFVLISARATLMTSFMLVGAHNWGLVGALVGQGIGTALAYPVVVWTARRYRAWDPLHDAIFALIGGAFGALALWLNQDALALLAGAGN